MNSKCKQCGGACCSGIVIKSTPESFNWFAMHGIEEGDKVYLPCACKHLKKGLCSIYDKRPEICIKYEVGSEACRNAVKRTGREFDNL